MDSSTASAGAAACWAAPTPSAGAGPATTIAGQLRFLQARPREVERAVADSGGPAVFQPVPSLEVAGRLLLSWDEAAVREVDMHYALRHALPSIPAVPGGAERVVGFSLPEQVSAELLRDD